MNQQPLKPLTPSSSSSFSVSDILHPPAADYLSTTHQQPQHHSRTKLDTDYRAMSTASMNPHTPGQTAAMASYGPYMAAAAAAAAYPAAGVPTTQSWGTANGSGDHYFDPTGRNMAAAAWGTGGAGYDQRFACKYFRFLYIYHI